MLENIIVAFIGVSFLVLMIWGFYVDRQQARIDVDTARKERERKASQQGRSGK